MAKVKSFRVFFKFFLFLYLPFLIFGAICTEYYYIYQSKRNFEHLKELEKTYLINQKNTISNNFDFVFSELSYLSKFSSLKEYLKLPSATSRDVLEKDLLNFAEHNSSYDQIRYLNTEGKEIVRINKSSKGFSIIPPEKLQDKSQRYYFKEALTLQRGEVYISPFDLNIEHGQVELPYKPQIRFASPIFNQEGKLAGVVVLNYLGQKLLNKLSTTPSNFDYPFNFLFLNKEGYFFKGFKPSEEWGFMFQGKKKLTFSHFFPHAWPLIKDKSFVQINSPKGLISSLNVTLNGEIAKKSLQKEHFINRWKLITFIPESSIAASKWPFFFQTLLLSIVFFFAWSIVWLIIFFFALHRQRQLAFISELNERKSTFVANVAHEFKNPLAIIREYLCMLEEEEAGPINEDQKLMLSSGRTALDRLNRLIFNLLNLSKIESGGIELTIEPCNLVELVSNILAFQQRDIDKRSLHLSTEFPDQPVTISVDRDKMTEVMTNLITNAIKYTPENGQITIRLFETSENIRFEIENSGSGLSQEQSTKIFDKFERITSEKTEGTGLGLPIAKELVELHNGNLWVESTPGKGNTFIVTLPLRKPK